MSKQRMLWLLICFITVQLIKEGFLERTAGGSLYYSDCYLYTTLVPLVRICKCSEFPAVSAFGLNHLAYFCSGFDAQKYFGSFVPDEKRGRRRCCFWALNSSRFRRPGRRKHEGMSVAPRRLSVQDENLE